MQGEKPSREDWELLPDPEKLLILDFLIEYVAELKTVHAAHVRALSSPVVVRLNGKDLA
jgi:hypothetical protein